MLQLPAFDIAVFLVYLVGVFLFGCWFLFRSRTADDFMAAGRSLPGWAIGLSVFGTYLSSNTFVGVPGSAYGGNWNFFAFSLSLPIAALVAVKWFIPFYRNTGEISAYHHLEVRFGVWARTFAVASYLAMQIARVGSILLGVAIAMSALAGWQIETIIIVGGIVVTLYTVIGGIAAVIWTDVVQSIILTVGALIAAGLLIMDMPGGAGQLIEIASEQGKFSLGGFGTSLTESTFWVAILFGIAINLKNFGIDQNFVQRYHAARSDADAKRSVWLGALVYLPVAALFLFIGTGLFSYYKTNAELTQDVRQLTAEQKLANDGVHPGSDGYAARLAETTGKLTDADLGDWVFPHFIAKRLPSGFAGLLIAALCAAAMSSIDSSLNSSATVMLSDIYRRYFRPSAGEAESMWFLRLTTLLWGALGTGLALSLIGVQSILATWLKLEGGLSGGMLGLFLLGLISHKAKSPAAAAAVVIGLAVMLWMTLSALWPNPPEHLKIYLSPLHANLTIVIGTMTILLVGLLVSRKR